MLSNNLLNPSIESLDFRRDSAWQQKQTARVTFTAATGGADGSNHTVQAFGIKRGNRNSGCESSGLIFCRLWPTQGHRVWIHWINCAWLDPFEKDAICGSFRRRAASSAGATSFTRSAGGFSSAAQKIGNISYFPPPLTRSWKERQNSSSRTTIKHYRHFLNKEYK